MPSFIDPDSIYPKRLGIMSGNTLIIQYYNLAKDKFKKHPIQFNPLDDTKSIIQTIFKDTRHIPYLKKVDPKHIKAVLEGGSVGIKKQKSKKIEEDIDFNNFEQNNNRNSSLGDERSSYQSEKEPISLKQQQKQQFVNNSKSNYNFPAFLPSKPVEVKKQQIITKQQVQNYYQQQFQDFEFSQSMDKNNNNSSNSNQNQSSSKSSELSKIQPKKFSKIEEEPVIQEVNQYEDDFQFIDEQQQAKKAKKDKDKDKKDKEKKDKDQDKEKKDKKKDKSKSKEKKSKKQKQVKKQKQAKPVQVKQVEEQFQFL